MPNVGTANNGQRVHYEIILLWIRTPWHFFPKKTTI